MAFGFRVLEIKSVPQSFKGDVVGVFQILHGVAQHLGPGADHLLEALLVVVALFKNLAVPERSLDSADEMVTLKRLEQVVVGSAAHGVNGDADVVDGDDHDHGKVGLLRVQLLKQSNAVEILHDNVSEHQIVGVRLERFKGFTDA